ncbi:iron complex transport system substrate-binding protein [Sinobacterium caligoides]|uniref:Iron complex transport system substrate-binding protein n=1 Tax=Sinobacterium caligoides TaxID=933926 RepID=A0A3N2DZ21_9GAMM|nr:ABC transporter substrate-binding protein [Sinobacterium caligoides]ROS05103.1 iron complex transport system substrate-binding protein [Sinobacterium caligoides]
MKKYLILSLLLLHTHTVLAVTAEKPVTVTSCNRQLAFDKPPQRAVSNDINLTEMMFALGLQKNMAGYSGVRGWQNIDSEFRAKAGNLPEISEQSPSLESLLAIEADFLFAGWNYGLSVGGSLTPSSLEPFGIKTYELTESCIHIMKKKPSSFNDVYNDLSNLGKIFSVDERASSLIQHYKKIITHIKGSTKTDSKVSVFVYDSGKGAPFTAGRYAMPSTMIDTAGGKNVMDDIQSSWVKTSWEAVVDRNPEFIVIVDYGKETAEDKINYLKQHPALTSINAIINDNFVVLSYAEATPGIRNFIATQRLAEAFQPQFFATKTSVERR